ncbi:MAG: hypothetical protein HYS18_11295 [Burkholderiales bacterium]|nr:hypothetical protein [Burkholderiales bacterium]
MKIDASTVEFTASHRASMRAEVKETLRAWIGDRPPAVQETAPSGASSAPSVVAISAAALSAAQAMPSAPPVAPQATGQAGAVDEMGAYDSPMLYLIKLVVEMLTGYQLKTIRAADFQPPQPIDYPQPPSQQQGAAQAPPRAGFGIEYDRHELYEESEHSQFHAEGVVRTNDGREIQFKVALEMSRSYREESNVSLRAGDAVRKDPLVINFDGTAAQLSSQRFAFDLDGDGEKEDVPLLTGNRGYLALDLDDNGKIDSGRELFGAITGDAFAELGHYDSDGNGWIDEGDAVFSQLQVWKPAEKGGGTLTVLKEHDVGAVYLGHAGTPFELRDQGNQELGGVRSSGVYLTENGNAGTVQQIDVSV